MYIDVKETIKKYFLAKMKEVYGDALSLEPILNFKKSWRKVGCYKWRQVGVVRFSYPQFLLCDDSDAEFHLD